MKTKIFAIIIATLSATSCKHTESVYHSKTASASTKFVKSNGIVQLPLAVDLVIEEKRVTGTFSSSDYVTTEHAKNMAVADALKQANADVLIEPQYYVEVTGTFTKAEASGHPAHYRNFRKQTLPADAHAATNLNVVKAEPVVKENSVIKTIEKAVARPAKR